MGRVDIRSLVMLNLPRWQTIGIIAVTVLAAVFALPNLREVRAEAMAA